MDISLWTPETKGAYVACAIDTDGWVGLRTTKGSDGHYRLTANVGVTNQSKEFLERIALLVDVPINISLNGKPGRDSRGILTKNEVWQSYWRSPIHVVKILGLAIPFLIAKKERAEQVFEFANGRINPASGLVFRSGKPYTERDWELMTLVTAANKKVPAA